MLRHRRRAVAGHVGDDDTAFLGRDGIHHVEASGDDADVFQVRQRLDDLAGHRSLVRDDHGPLRHSGPAVSATGVRGCISQGAMASNGAH
jgi:hypothetical protein